MATNTSIEWTHRGGTIPTTWNPTTGCDKISEGCGLPRFDGDLPGGCYAMAMAKRLKGMGSAKYQNDGNPITSGPGFGLTVHPDTLTEPLRWRDPRTVFVNSMSDLFHARVPRDFLARVFATMGVTPQHTYQILTKRPERMARVLAEYRWWTEVVVAGLEIRPDARFPTQTQPDGCALNNVWLGTSIESDEHTLRADALRATPAAVRFISAEPLLGPLPSLDLTGINLLILGGESGPGSRPVDTGWFRELIGMARAAGTAIFVKQMGSAWASETSWGGQLVSRTDKKGGDWSFWPDDLKIREYPATREAVAP
jgi:protein gp37